jgi:hypothetical protein
MVAIAKNRFQFAARTAAEPKRANYRRPNPYEARWQSSFQKIPA